MFLLQYVPQKHRQHGAHVRVERGVHCHEADAPVPASLALFQTVVPVTPAGRVVVDEPLHGEVAESSDQARDPELLGDDPQGHLSKRKKHIK